MTLVVNYLALIDLDGYGAFGGALAVARDGCVLGRMPVGRTGVLWVEVG